MDDFRPVDPDRILALVDELGASPLGLTPILSPAELGRLSADFHDYSPVLEPLLKGCCAQVAVKVERLEQVMAVAGACARHQVPLTLRGAGTGNYGQCVPLAGVVEAEPGCTLAHLDGQLAAHGRAMRLAPSTYRSATLGGFIAGGSGGLGSLRWGFLRDPGHLLGLEVVTLEAQPRLLRLDAAASAPLNHAYGTNGIITALRLATTEAVAWEQVVVGFSRWEEALEASRELPATALLLHALCLLEAPVAARMPWPAGCPAAAPGEHRLLLHVAPDSLELLPGWLAARGGQLRWQGPRPEAGRGRGLPLGELTWNHTTLHWRAQAPDWTYLQLLLPRPEAPLLEAVRQRWGSDVLWHLEGVRYQGAPRLTALPLVRWQGPQALADLVAQCRGLGAVPFNPHVITVEDGGLGVVDADQVAAKAAYDPAGLMNPGKLRGWVG
jgi:FAD/FMN-containing dehydrogenase